MTASTLVIADRVRPESTALVLIDMSNDFVHPDGKTARLGGRDVSAAWTAVPAMRRLHAAARAAGVTVVHVQHTTLPGGASDSAPWVDARRRATYSVPDICLDGTWGQEIIPELQPADGDLTVKKYRYGGFTGTNLELVLRSTGTTNVICCGVSTNVCVETTAREAFSREFFVVIPADACASWDMRLHEATLESARHRYAVVTTTEEILTAWSGVQPS